VAPEVNGTQNNPEQKSEPPLIRARPAFTPPWATSANRAAHREIPASHREPRCGWLRCAASPSAAIPGVVLCVADRVVSLIARASDDSRGRSRLTS
jgi:hypothetical protein